MSNTEVFQLCNSAILAARDGDFVRAENKLNEAAKSCGLLTIPLVGFGEAGRIACADALREIYKEKIARGIPIPILPDGFDLEDPYREWRNKYARPSVFISHSSKDKSIARSICKFLTANHIDVWLDAAEIKFGESLIEKIGKSINQVDVVLAIISPNSIDSEWVKRELEIATTLEIEEKPIRIIPILIQNAELPIFLKGRLFADFSNNYRRKKNKEKLLISIRELSKL